METIARTMPVHQMEGRKNFRIISIDFLRGLVMIIMAIDHTRDFIHIDANLHDPLDLQTTTPFLFFTRLITHYCAPVFVFLSGTSIFLQGLRKTTSALSVFLIKRGLWLLFVEVIIITFGITFNPSYSVLILQVIWAIGINMVILGLLIRFPYYILLSLGLLIVFGHNCLDFYENAHTGPFPLWYDLLHKQAFVPSGKGPVLGIFYPFLPWTGIMLLGYSFGKIYTKYSTKEKQNKVILLIGLSLTALFIFLRFTNVYGDPLHWKSQRNTLYTIFSFVNTQKYPPSLLYFCMTIGPALIFLGLMGNVQNKFTAFVTTYGKVPFLYYVLHFYILHVIAAVLFLSRGHSFSEGSHSSFLIHFEVPGEGYSLGITYLIWFVVVLALYPVCKWFAKYKHTHKSWWLSYL